MTRFIVSRIALTLMSVGLIVFSLAPNLPTNAQDKNTCKDLGWTEIDGTQIDLSGEWSAHQNRNCKESADWQFNFSVTITKEDNGDYKGTVSDRTPLEVHLQGSGIVFVRDLRNGAGEDENKQNLQTWKGKIERNKDGRIRIYGMWSGAFASRKKEGYNMDFMMMK
jgi:hypothetical protein